MASDIPIPAKRTPAQWVSGILDHIERHDSYGPRMRAAVASDRRLILNYHTHGRTHGYCVSICHAVQGAFPVLGQHDPLEEIVHISRMGSSEDQCVPLMSLFAELLREHYRLRNLPLIYLNGRPIAPM
ncbi:MAG: hypothetical protein HYU36_02860 [Planctomycetes bacterium]|nr:hypothetical protein [Planctomycetota bacterium]